MGKNKFLKWLAPLGLGAVLMGIGWNHIPTVSVNANTHVVTPETTIKANKVTLNNTALSSRIRSLLGLTSNQTLNSDAFLNCDAFKADAPNPIYQLDLSGTGITDIRELAQFEFPSHIQGINLAGNGITNEHLSHITSVCELAKDATITLGERTLTSNTDFAAQIMKINLNDNKIDLNTIDSSYLSNTKLLFGVQNMGEIHSSGLVMKGEINPTYYIRSNSDENYLTFTFTNDMHTVENGVLSITRDAVTPIIGTLNDRYTISVSSVPNSSTAYFSGYSLSKEFIQFTLSLDDHFKVERKNLLNLKVSSDGKLLEGTPINIDGFGNNASLHIAYDNASTSSITTDSHKNYVNITLTKGSKTRTIPLEFKVVDTIKPVIILKGSAHAYSSKNKSYSDPGVIAYDPSVLGADTGDDMSSMVVTNNQVDVTTLGEYAITYTVTDLAGNTTTVTRIVEIQEQVLDTITLRTNTDKFVDGDDIVLVVQPSSDVEISKYKDIRYYWYINDVLFQETKGDNVTGKSTITIIGDSSNIQNIYVKLKATQISDNAQIEVFSDTLTIQAERGITGDNAIIIATTIVVLLILGAFVTLSILKYRKSKGKTHGKHKNVHKGKKKNNVEEKPVEKGPEIQVIKDYKEGSSNNENTQPMNNPSSNNNNNQQNS